MRFLIGVGLTLVLMILGMGSYFMAFLDIPSLLITLPALIMAIFSTSFSTFLNSLKFIFTKSKPQSEEEMEKSIIFFSISGNCGILVGIIGSLIGAVIMLQNLDDTSKIGPAMAIAIITVFYGVIIKFFSFAAEKRVKFRYLEIG